VGYGPATSLTSWKDALRIRLAGKREIICNPPAVWPNHLGVANHLRWGQLPSACAGTNENEVLYLPLTGENQNTHQAPEHVRKNRMFWMRLAESVPPRLKPTIHRSLGFMRGIKTPAPPSELSFPQPVKSTLISYGTYGTAKNRAPTQKSLTLSGYFCKS